MAIHHNTLAALEPVISGIDPAHRLLALVQTRDALNQIIDAAQKKPNKRKPAKGRVMSHAAVLDLGPAPAPKKPDQPPFKAEVRNGLIVVTFPEGKAGYLKHGSVLGSKVFGWSHKDKEWRASLAWVRKNQPELLKGLGLDKMLS